MIWVLILGKFALAGVMLAQIPAMLRFIREMDAETERRNARCAEIEARNEAYRQRMLQGEHPGA